MNDRPRYSFFDFLSTLWTDWPIWVKVGWVCIFLTLLLTIVILFIRRMQPNNTNRVIRLVLLSKIMVLISILFFLKGISTQIEIVSAFVDAPKRITVENQCLYLAKSVELISYFGFVAFTTIAFNYIIDYSLKVSFEADEPVGSDENET